MSKPLKRRNKEIGEVWRYRLPRWVCHSSWAWLRSTLIPVLMRCPIFLPSRPGGGVSRSWWGVRRKPSSRLRHLPTERRISSMLSKSHPSGSVCFVGVSGTGRWMWLLVVMQGERLSPSSIALCGVEWAHASAAATRRFFHLTARVISFSPLFLPLSSFPLSFPLLFCTWPFAHVCWSADMGRLGCSGAESAGSGAGNTGMYMLLCMVLMQECMVQVRLTVPSKRWCGFSSLASTWSSQTARLSTGSPCPLAPEECASISAPKGSAIVAFPSTSSCPLATLLRRTK